MGSSMVLHRLVVDSLVVLKGSGIACDDHWLFLVGAAILCFVMIAKLALTVSKSRHEIRILNLRLTAHEKGIDVE